MKTLSSQLLSLLFLIAATFHLLPPSSAAAITIEAPTPAPAPIDFIRSVCTVAEDDADICYSSISPYANVINQNVNTLCCVGLTLAYSEARRVDTYISDLSYEAKARFGIVISVCNFTLGVASNQISDLLGTIRKIAAGKGGDFNSTIFKVLTEMAAAMTNQDTCIEEL